MDASASHAEAAAPAAAPADRELRDACLAQLPGAREAFVERFSGLLFLVADRTAAQRGMELSPADREALVADMLVGIFRDDAALLRAFALRSSLASYLTVCARRIAVQALIHRLESGPPAIVAEPPPDPEDPVFDVPDTAGADPAPNLLEAEEVRLLKLYHRDRKSYGEISRIMGLALGSIGPALARARLKLRQATGRNTDRDE